MLQIKDPALYDKLYERIEEHIFENYRSYGDGCSWHAHCVDCLFQDCRASGAEIAKYYRRRE